ncbi:uncharacterized protein RHOBADRAFT_43927 [Rhodotorula graminis WP1]|uniref:Zn(2)-C6 fungal-type domain-containing protein n=1 Tax=Rhodotorula graminis (strain WP1) TaxID=578459 RepID=A0A194S4A9_RHOGW|nr:uncharacterized protein RHOBADRAFT_43927 [Rhodotorula graminis WP1]KPV75422.1 hypothetical protein RHOBADRAFT_43927 [Rhodotorula graminis WP1]
MGEAPTTATTTRPTAALDLDTDSSSWHREGPVRLLQGDRWTRKNGPVACEPCRRRRVRCSSFETGAPCLACIRRNEDCSVGDDTYTPDTPSTTIFVPILPPPPAPCTSPISSSAAPPALDLDAVNTALESRIPRPAPLVWKSTDDSLQHSGPSTRGLRQKRPAPSYVDDEPDPPTIAPRPPLKKRSPALPANDAPSDPDIHLEQLEPTLDMCSSSAAERIRRTSPFRPTHLKLRRHVPEAPASHLPSTVKLAVFCSRTRTLARLEALKAASRRALELVKRSPASHSFPLSSARDEPVPSRRPLILPPSSSSPPSHVLLAASTRRDSLASSSSLVSERSALFERAAVSERRWSTATSASSIEGGIVGREGGVAAWHGES